MRLSASLVLAARSRSFTHHQARHAVLEAVRTYRERMTEYAAMRAIDVYYARVDSSEIVEFANKRARPYLESTIQAAAHHDALHELPKITTLSEGKRRIGDHPPIITHPPEVGPERLRGALASYRENLQEDRRVLLDRYQIVDAALKVVGVGSVGLGAYVALLEGGSDDDPLFLQAKVAEASVFERFTHPARSPPMANGSSPDSACSRPRATCCSAGGWPSGRTLYIRQLQDQKGSPVVEVMDPRRPAWPGAACAAGRWREAMLARVIRRCSRGTSATTTRRPRDGRLRRPCMPTRPNATMRRSWPPSRTAGSRQRPASDRRSSSGAGSSLWQASGRGPEH